MALSNLITIKNFRGQFFSPPNLWSPLAEQKSNRLLISRENDFVGSEAHLRRIDESKGEVNKPSLIGNSRGRDKRLGNGNTDTIYD